MYKIGLFGGTFNPMHYGHIKMLNKFKEEISLTKIFIIPSGYSYHKDNRDYNIDHQHKLRMCQLSIECIESAEVSSIDTERIGNTYTIDTIHYFMKNFPKKQFWWLIGSDAFLQLHTWKEFEQLKENLCFAIAPRKENKTELKTKIESYTNIKQINPEKFKILSMIPNKISSSDIRERINNHQSISHLVHPKVEQYIYKNKLY